MSIIIAGFVKNGVVPNAPLPEGAQIEIHVNDGPDGEREKERERRSTSSSPSLGRPHSARPALIPPATNCMNAIDTNVWLYSHDTRDRRKQRLAQRLVAAVRPLALPWQVGCEFVAASRKFFVK